MWVIIDELGIELCFEFDTEEDAWNYAKKHWTKGYWSQFKVRLK